MKEIRIRITGTSSLLTHNPAGMATPSGAAKKKRIPTPEEEAEAGLYLGPGGTFQIRQAAFRASAFRAAQVTRLKVGRIALSTLIKGCLFPIEEHEFADLYYPDTRKPLKKYGIDTRRAVLKSGAAVMRSRPKFEKWGCEIVLEYDEEDLSPKTIIDLLNVAGRRIGVGDYRPDCPKGLGGFFGRYCAELV